MQSNNGDLYYRAGIDIDGFNVSAEAMERKMSETTTSIVQDAGRMDDAISKIGGAFTKIAGMSAAGAFVKQIFNVRSEMQNTEATLRVMLGSAEKADAFFKNLQGYAYNNVFEFKDLAQQSAQLLAFGNAADDVIDIIDRLSEVSAATKAPLSELVDVWNKVKSTDSLDAMSIKQLGAKGVDVRQALADIQSVEQGTKVLATQVDVTGLKFADLEKIIAHVTDEGGRFHGVMVEQMKTLGDSWGLMQDNITNMFNEIGEQTQGIMKSGMDAANYLIEHYQEVAKILGTLVVAFGAAKAANIAMNLAQKNGTGIAVLDNTVWAIKAKTLQNEIQIGHNVTSSIREIKKAQEEEIATLKASITTQEHDEMLKKSRIVNIKELLTAQQQHRLAQMGVNEASDEYIQIASSMLTKEQKVSLAKADLTENNQAYIDALREAVSAHNEEAEALEKQIEAAAAELKASEEEVDWALLKRDRLKDEVAAREEAWAEAMKQADGISEVAAEEALEATRTELSTAQRELNEAADRRSTNQKKLLELQEKKNAIAQANETAATNADTVAKTRLGIVVDRLKLKMRALWAVMVANPIGAIVTIATTLFSVLSSIIGKTKEAEEATTGLTRANKKAEEEYDKERAKIDSIVKIINDHNVGIETRKKKLAELKGIVKDYHADLTTEGTLINNNTSAITDYCRALEKQIRLKAAQEELEDAYRRKRQAEKSKKAADEHYNKEVEYQRRNSEMGLYGAGENGALMGLGDAQRVVSASNKVKDAERELVSIDREIEELTAEIGDVSASAEQAADTAITVATRRKELQKEIAELQRQINEATKDGAHYDKEALEALQKRLKDRSAELQNLNGGKEQLKAQQELEKNKKALTEAELELELARQEAIISMMEEGGEKQLALAELQYQRQIAAVERAKKEYIKKQKEAGAEAVIVEGSDADLSFKAQEEAALQERMKAQRKAFDNELDYRKRQYQQYYDWVEQMGEEVANVHFKELLKGGNSYMAWLDNTIAELQQKQANGMLTDGEAQYLFDLLNEKDVQTGAKSALDKFMDDVERATNNAPTLIEKLEALQKALRDLEDVDGGELAKNNVALQLAQQITDTQNQIDDIFDEKYRTYNEKRRQLERDYLADIIKLQGQGRGAEADNLRKEMQNALKDLDTDFLKGIVSVVFKAPTKKNMTEALKTLQEIQDMTLAQFNSQFGTEDYQITEEQLVMLKSRIGEVGAEIKKLGQGYTIADAFKDIKNGRIEGDMEKVARGTDYMQNAFSKFASTVSALSGALNELADASNSQSLKDTAKTVNSISNVINTAGSMAGTGASIGGGWGAIIGAVLGGGIGIVTEVLKSNAEIEERRAKAAEEGVEFQKHISDQLVSILGAVESLSDTVTSLNYEQFRTSLNELIQELKTGENLYTNGYNGKKLWNYIYDAVNGSGYNNLRWNVADFGNTDGKNLNDIWKRLVEAGLISKKEAEQRNGEVLRGARHEDWNSRVDNAIFGWLDDLVGNERTHTYHIDEDEYREGTAKSIANYLNWRAGQYADEQKKLIEKLQQLYEQGSYDSLEYFNAQHDVWKHELEELRFYQSMLEQLGEDTSEYDRQIETLEHQMGESLKNMAEGLFGMDIQSLIEDWISIFEEFGDNVDGAFNKIDQNIDKMIANMLLTRMVIEPLLGDIMKIFDDYAKEVGTDHAYTEDDFKEIGNRIKDAKDDAYTAMQKYQEALEAAGISIDSLNGENTLTGSIQNLSEETGGIIAGRMNAMVINQAETTGVLRQSLAVQFEMRNYLSIIAEDVSVIKRNTAQNNIPTFNQNMNYGFAERIR